MRRKRCALPGSFLFAAVVWLASGGGFRPAAHAAGRRSVEDVLRSLRELVRKGGSSVGQALRLYNGIERAGSFDIFGRRRIHTDLVAELRNLDDRRSLSYLTRYLDSTSSSSFPAKVVVMKAMLGEKFPLPRKERVRRFLELAHQRHMRTFLWAVRLLGDSTWPEAVDALISLLGRLQAGKGKDRIRACIAGMELYRVLGNYAPQGALASAIKARWESLRKKLPEKPDYSLTAGSGRTVSFFGDIISPLSVFAIDHSTSMRQKTTLADLRRGTVVRGKQGAGGRQEQKVVIVKRELVRSVQSLRPEYKFNILGYNAKVYAWRPLKLYPATSSNKASAQRFARELEVKRGTNIYEVMKVALGVPEVETVYLLSDGVPSVGGNQAAIQKLVRAMNYLRGIRVVTYGFAAEKRGSYDEKFMRLLAKANWGWYRRLNR